MLLWTVSAGPCGGEHLIVNKLRLDMGLSDVGGIRAMCRTCGRGLTGCPQWSTLAPDCTSLLRCHVNMMVLGDPSHHEEHPARSACVQQVGCLNKADTSNHPTNAALQPEMPVYISAKRGSLSWENRASVLSMFFAAS